jgi:FKBP-type peptidyl-prolyl cis-trans isomerase
MRKIHFSALSLLTAGLLLSGHAAAQQTPAPTTQQSPAATPAPATKAQTTPAAKKPATTSTAKKPAAPLVLTTPKDKASYAIGMNIGKGMHQQSVDVDPAILLRGLKDGLAGGKTLMTEEEAKAALIALQAEVKKKQEEVAKAQGEVNKKEGDAFLAANKVKDGVVTTPSGLQYKILQQGSGPKPTAEDTVVCNYRGTLLNGKEFDSSYKRGQPATFPVKQVIPGWTEALQLMSVGSKWQLVLPASLAYGERSAGPDISPNSTLVFEVELMSIKPPAPEKPAPKPALEQPGGKPVVNPVEKPADAPAAKPADQPKP